MSSHMGGVFQVGTFIFSIISFLIVFFFIQRFAFRPLAKMLEQRRQHVESQITEAEKSREEAASLLAEQRRLLDEARKEAKNLLDAARVRADEQAREILLKAEEEASRILEENRQAIVRERDEALAAVTQRVAELSVELTAKLLHSHVSPELHREMVAEAEKRLGELVC
ncbi:ATP synthase F0, B subunit [Alicyclobacillus hesperidum URH17-3-68]|uniref:ATP synthase subunit b n=2 Tax=Alicyclobacillus hesperidum TaxID=89784 RepID=A0AA37X358_9BACL|nr:ATP synthase F0, B subunit [Alicyclobacillus hesperidum URH17-3-68]GLG02014.1 ATP synthase subunit b [Alicyclobacillus hesperidum subsp. aegles]GLV14210.1 ATP synthase subunit b [Alicyclobacillus hesperidum]